MAHLRYETVLRIFVAITILLVAIVVALFFWPREKSLDFDFPDELPTFYIKLQDWPPQVQILNAKFGCEDAGNAVDRAGRTELREIDGHTFCVTEVQEGAAGSIYTQYAYAFEHEGDTVVLTFTTRAPQCGNYPEPEMSVCAKERAEFSVDKFVADLVEDAE